MSLFGDEDGPIRPKSSLFDDGPGTPGKSSSSMFQDDLDNNNSQSPWGFTPKKSTGKDRGSLVKSLLADADVPDLYIDTFDDLQAAGTVKAQDCQQLIKDSGVRVADRERIWSVVTSGSDVAVLGRGEFNVLLALIGLSQEGEEQLGLDEVDERRRKLPIPTLPGAQSKSKPKSEPQAPPIPQQSEVHAGAQATPAQATSSPRKPSFGAGFGESDPWGSPAMHKGHGHLNGIGAPQRTTSNFTTNSASEPNESTGSYGNGQTASSVGTGSWGGSTAFPAGIPEGFGNAGQSGDGFGDGGVGAATARRPQQPRISTNQGAEELITVNLLEEKEGMFMFQHRNYEVASVRRNSKVIRRYSDFVWLLDCLHKRYPFRQLPLLPPKRVSINGNHIASDSAFLEKRRRGLVRFANALVRHPVLREEQLVVMFLTVPTELAVWRKQATISVQEEFVGRTLPPTLEDSLPQNLQDTFDTVRSGVVRSADLYINLCSLVERLCKRKEALAGEYGRLNLNLTSLSEASMDTYAIDTNDVPLLNEGINGTAKHVETSKGLIDDEARAWDQGVLEDAKTMRDSLVSVRDMFDRRDRYARDNIPQLERKIQANEQKLQGIRAKGDAAKPGEADKVANAITAVSSALMDLSLRLPS